MQLLVLHRKFVSGVANGLRSGLGGSTSSSASSPLQTGFAPKSEVLLYPSDVGTNHAPSKLYTVCSSLCIWCKGKSQIEKHQELNLLLKQSDRDREL